MYDNDFSSSDLDSASVTRTNNLTGQKEMSMCNRSRIYGGYLMLNNGSKSFSVTYSNMPAHTTMIVRYRFYMLDAWSATDTM